MSKIVKNTNKIDKKIVATDVVVDNKMRFDEIFNNILNKFSRHYDEDECKYMIPLHIINEVLGTDIKSLTKEQAKEIFYRDFYQGMRLTEIKNSRICEAMYEFAVIIEDIQVPVTMLKQSFNLLNMNYSLSESNKLSDKDINVINSYKFFKLLYRVLISKISNYLEGTCAGDNDEVVRFNKKIFREWVNGK